MKTLMTDIETWHPSQSPLAIEYTRLILDEVRDQAVAGYRRLARGGVEVGGILFGEREDGKVRILATQPIACEYSTGPSFVLSGKDRARLRNQVIQAESDETLQGLSIVGWYVSHPRGKVALSDRDLDIFNEFFPAIWNITLVMKPVENGIRGGFFVREARGSLNFAQSYQEFEMALPKSAEGSSAVRQIADQVASSLAAQRSPASESDTRHRGGGRRDVPEMPSPSPRSEGMPRAFVTGAATAPALETAKPANWSTAVARPRSAIVADQRPEHSPRRLKWRWLVVWVVAVAGVIAGSYAYREFTAPAPLGLRVAEKDGDLIVQWDPSTRPLQWASAAKLEIHGADLSRTVIDLNAKELATGKYQYGGIEGDTSIRLSVTGKMGFHADESTRFVAQVAHPEPPRKPIEIRDRRKLQAEVRRLREELDKSQQRVKELESLLYNR